MRTRPFHRSVCCWCLVGLGLYIGSMASVGLAQVEKRTWHAASGGFSVEAELADIRDDKVQLKKRDGTSIWVELQKLSLSDIKYVEESLQKAREGLRKKLGSESNAPMPKTEPTKADGKLDAPGVSNDASKEVEPRENNERLPGWDVDVESGGSKSPFAGMKEINLVLGQTSAHDLVYPVTPSIWMAIHRSLGGNKFQVANLRTGKLLEPFEVAGFANQKALSPDGATFATAEGFPSKITLYATSNGKKIKEFTTAEVTSMSKMLFVSPQQLLVIGLSQRSVGVLYDVKTGKASKTIELESATGRNIAVSPNGKILAVPSHSNTVSLFDLKTGKKKSDLALVSDKGNSWISISDLCFCRDGLELVVLGTSGTTELHAFSMKTGRATVRHTLSDSLSSICPGNGSYVGPPVESLSGNKGWILFGSAIVDREKGGPVWVDDASNSSRGSPFRVMIDDNKQLALVGDFRSMRLEVVSLPWSDISKSKDTVAKGGTVEDAGLPEVVLVEASSAPMVNAALNPNLYSGERLANKSHPKPKPIPIDKSLGLIVEAHFGAADRLKCVVVPATFQGKQKTAQLIDLAGGKVEKSFDASVASRIHGLSQDARWLVGTTGKNNDRVDIFDVQKGKHFLGFRPSSSSGFRAHLTAVEFVAKDLLLTVASDQQAVVWELPNLKPRYRFTSLGSGYPFPSSGHFLHRNEHGWVVRNAEDGSVAGMLEGSNSDSIEIPRYATFLDDESACAALTGVDHNQKLIVWDLTTGKRKREVAMTMVTSSNWSMGLDSNRRLTVFDSISRKQVQDFALPNAESIAWCNNDQILVKWLRQDSARFSQPGTVSPTVYSLVSTEDGRILWDYRVPLGVSFDGGPQGQLWFTEQSTKGYALVGFEVPTDEVKKQLSKATNPKPILAKGDALAIDLKVTISGDSLADGLFRDQAFGAIQENLKKHNIDISDRAGLKMSIRVDQVVENNGNRGKGSIMMLVSCQVTNISNEVLWLRSKLIGAASTGDDKAILAEDIRKKEWSNVLVWLKENVDPSAIYEKWYYRGLGESILSSSGEKLVETKGAADR